MKKTWKKNGRNEERDLQVTHGAGFTVKKRLWSHPFDWKTSLCETKTSGPSLIKTYASAKNYQIKIAKKEDKCIFYCAANVCYATCDVRT